MVLDVRAWALALVGPIKLRALAHLRRLRDSALALLAGDGGGLLRKIAQLRDSVRNKPRA
jgi:hypothetical protein